MSSEVFSRCVAPPTLCTAVGLFGCVAELVLLQVAHLKETLPTAGTLVAPLSGLQRYCDGLSATLRHRLAYYLIWNQLSGPIRTLTPSTSLLPWGWGRANRGCVLLWGQVMKVAWFGCQAGAAAGRRSCRCCVCCGRSIFGGHLFHLPAQLLVFYLLFCFPSSSCWSSRLQGCHLLQSVLLDNWFGYKSRLGTIIYLFLAI